MQKLLMIALACLACACASSPSVQTWGTLREVFAEGATEGRVELIGDGRFVGAAGSEWIGVGALAGLDGEVTLAEQHVRVSRVVDGEAHTRAAEPGDQAALLIAAEVRGWTVYSIGPIADLATLEAELGALLEREGYPLDEPTPIRISGRATALDLHVIAGACPIANPDGPAPFRATYTGPVTLVGFYAEGLAGTVTHHGRRVHLHGIVPAAEPAAGHLDAVQLENASIHLPQRPKRDSNVTFGLGFGAVIGG